MPFIASGGAAFMNYSLIESSWVHAAIYYVTGIILAIFGSLFYKKE